MRSRGACVTGVREVCTAGGMHGRRDGHCMGRYATLLECIVVVVFVVFIIDIC